MGQAKILCPQAPKCGLFIIIFGCLLDKRGFENFYYFPSIIGLIVNIVCIPWYLFQVWPKRRWTNKYQVKHTLRGFSVMWLGVWFGGSPHQTPLDHRSEYFFLVISYRRDDLNSSQSLFGPKKLHMNFGDFFPY